MRMPDGWVAICYQANNGRVFFHWYEYAEIIKFEEENPNYKCIHVDTDGVTYEYRTDYVMDPEEVKKVINK